MIAPRTYIVSPYPAEELLYSGINLYGMLRRKSEDFARSINQELAEGPTLLITKNQYGPVELWPLVLEGEDAIPR